MQNTMLQRYRYLCMCSFLYGTDFQQTIMNFCGVGASCVSDPVNHWYTCQCDPGFQRTDIYTCAGFLSDVLPLLTSELATNPCQLYGCGTNADCTDGPPLGLGVRICTCRSMFSSPLSGFPLTGNTIFPQCLGMGCQFHSLIF